MKENKIVRGNRTYQITITNKITYT